MKAYKKKASFPFSPQPMPRGKKIKEIKKLRRIRRKEKKNDPVPHLNLILSNDPLLPVHFATIELQR